MFTIAVANSKGGVGKTTLSAYLAALLADLGLRALLIDADVQPPLRAFKECLIPKTFFALMFVATLMGCQKSPTQNADQRSAEAPQKITVAYTFQPQSTLVHIATAKGYFVGEGLDVQPLMHTYGKAALQSVLDNKADFATVAETPIMFSVLKDDKIFVIANIEASSLNNGDVARKSAGIATPGDLKGKRIGLTPGTTSDFFLDSLLTAHGLTRQGVQPIALKPEEMLEAIVAKKVDAVSIWNYPVTQIKRQLGSDGTIFYDRESGSGIGLYMSKMIMDNMGGDIAIQNVKGGAEVLLVLRCPPGAA